MSQRFSVRWLLFSSVFALLLGGCSTSQPRDREPIAPEEAPAPEEKPAAATETTPEPARQDPPDVSAQDENYRKIAEELLRNKTLAEQKGIVESSEAYRRALKAFQQGRFKDAQRWARQAVESNPENLQARQLLTKIDSVIAGEGFGAPSIQDSRVQEIQVRIQAAQVEITNHIRNGERFFNARMYAEAIDEFEEAAFQIHHIPYDVPAMKKLEPMVLDHVRKAKNARKMETERVRDMKRKEAETESYAHSVATRREITRKIAYLLELAYMAFDQKKFDQCMRLAGEILMIDPHYTVAMDLREDAKKARHRNEYFNFIRKKVNAWKELTSADDEAVIPYSETVRFPSREEWAEISKRITESVLSIQEGGPAEDPDILAIQNTLNTMKVPVLDFVDSTLEDIVNYIRDYANLNIVIDGSISEVIDLEKQISFTVTDVVLKTALRLLLSQFELDYTITPEKVVFITTPQNAAGKPVVELHDIRDILVKIQDFPGPSVELSSPGGGGGALTGATFTLEEPTEAAVGQEQIEELIRENIAPNTWDEGDYSLEVTPNQQLLVNHTPKVHQEIRSFLTKLRRYTGTMVSITARFISAYDDFLDDFGVDIINRDPTQPGFLNAAGAFDVPGGITTDMDEPAGQAGSITGATTNIGPGLVTNESARLEAYDLRAQTFHSLLQVDPLTGIGIDPLSNRLVNQGGLGLQYQWLGEQALQTVVRALHKGQKATLVQAPRITVFNTQRSHVMVLGQRAYIQDLDPQISTLAAAYDPVIGILTYGVVLDVRPIVSNDRKYVTLELRPSLAQLQALRSIDINTGSANPAPGTTVIQLPWLVLQKAETTVIVPDRGSLMISGFKDIMMRDIHSGVPFLENIPVLNFFFTRKGKASERRRLLILVTPEIIDLAEREESRY